MSQLKRHSELYSADRKRRLVVMERLDGLFALQEEQVRDYAAEDEWNPDILPFCENTSLNETSIIWETEVNGIFGSAEDAEREAVSLLR